jgi:uncharacterized protein with HEPN domain
VKDDGVYLRHIRDAIVKIEGYASVGHERFLSESHWHDAIIRQLEIIGEATKRLSPDLRARYPEMPWRRVAGLRDVLIHQYMGVDLEAVWGIVDDHIPTLKLRIEQILSTDFPTEDHDRSDP